MPIQKIAPCLWFDGQAEEAAKFYTSIFKNSRITATARYGETGQEITGGKPGSVMTVAFEIDGHPFTALNGGPHFKFSEAISFEVFCDTQKDVDYYWEKLGAGGDPKAQQCGWLKDKFGVSWQVIPKELPDLLMDSKSASGQRAMAALLKMKKLDIDELRAAYAG